MDLKTELENQLEETLRDFHHLLDSVPESLYHHPSDNPAWTMGDVLFHIAIGTHALRFEIWMIRHARGLFQFFANDVTAHIFNWSNAIFTHRPKQITRQSLIKVYEEGHAGLRSSLKRMDETDFQKSVIYPKSLVPELAGIVTIEILFRYAKEHFDVHKKQISNILEEIK